MYRSYLVHVHDCIITSHPIRHVLRRTDIASRPSDIASRLSAGRPTSARASSDYADSRVRTSELTCHRHTMALLVPLDNDDPPGESLFTWSLPTELELSIVRSHANAGWTLQQALQNLSGVAATSVRFRWVVRRLWEERLTPIAQHIPSAVSAPYFSSMCWHKCGMDIILLVTSRHCVLRVAVPQDGAPPLPATAHELSEEIVDSMDGGGFHFHSFSPVGIAQHRHPDNPDTNSIMILTKGDGVANPTDDDQPAQLTLLGDVLASADGEYAGQAFTQYSSFTNLWSLGRIAVRPPTLASIGQGEDLWVCVPEEHTIKIFEYYDGDAEGDWQVNGDARLLRGVPGLGVLGWFDTPTRVVEGDNGLIYICDSGNHRVQVLRRHTQSGAYVRRYTHQRTIGGADTYGGIHTYGGSIGAFRFPVALDVCGSLLVVLDHGVNQPSIQPRLHLHSLSGQSLGILPLGDALGGEMPLDVKLLCGSPHEPHYASPSKPQAAVLSQSHILLVTFGQEALAKVPQ